MRSQPASYHGYRFPPDIISHAVWLYHRFCLSFRDAEDLLAQRGVTVTYEGCVATFKKRQEIDGSGRAGAVSCNHPEQLVDELNRCFRHQLLLPRPYLVLTKPLRLDI